MFIFLKQSTKFWRNFDWSSTISLELFPQRMPVEYAISKTQQSAVPTYL